MKKTFIALLLLISGASVSYAQGGGGGFQMPTPEERVKRVHTKIDSAFAPGEDKMKQIDALFLDFYNQQDKVREEMRANGGGGGGQAMQEALKPHQDALDAKLKPVLGEDNFKIWKEQIEPTLRRGGGRGGPPRNN